GLARGDRGALAGARDGDALVIELAAAGVVGLAALERRGALAVVAAVAPAEALGPEHQALVGGVGAIGVLRARLARPRVVGDAGVAIEAERLADLGVAAARGALAQADLAAAGERVAEAGLALLVGLAGDAFLLEALFGGGLAATA